MSAWRILIGNHRAVVRPGLESLLAELGLQLCGQAKSLRQAAQQVRRLKPDLVLLELSPLSPETFQSAREVWRQLPARQVFSLALFESQKRLDAAFADLGGGRLAEASAVVALATATTLPRRQSAALCAMLLRGILLGWPPAHPKPAPKAGLTAREQEIVRLVAEGRTSKAIGHQLSISLKTVETHRANIMRKLHLHSVGELVRYAIRHHLVAP